MAELEDLALSAADGDIYLDADGDLAGITGAQRVAQQIQTRLRSQAGEWALDITSGPDWLGRIFTKPGDLTLARALLVEQIVQVPDVLGVQSVDLSLDSATRRLTGTFRASSVVGVASGSIV